MAQKRMFRLDVLETDAFMDMPLTSQALYFHLGLRADDDGFVGNPKRITKSIGASEDDLKLLIAKKFVIIFEDGVIVIKHWRLHNSLSGNRYHETKYLEDKSMLTIKDNGSYTLSGDGNVIDDSRYIEMGQRQTKDEQKTNTRRTKDEHKTDAVKYSIDKNSIEENRIDNNTHADGVWDIHKHTNVENLSHFLNYEEYKNKQFFLNNMNLYESIKEWMAYKDQRKPKRDNFYVSIKTFLNVVVKNAQKYGVDVVIDVINDSIGANYQGIVWDWCEKKKPVKKNNDIDEVLNSLV